MWRQKGAQYLPSSKKLRSPSGAAKCWGVFAYSRAGYGRSDPVALPRPLDYMTREARLSLPTVLEAIRFERGILLGHSDGASIAALYAGERFAERVNGLVLIAPH